MTTSKKLLGDWSFFPSSFQTIDKAMKPLLEPSFVTIELRHRFKKINTTLLELIQDEPTPCFLLPQTLDFIHRVNEAKLLDEPFSLSCFEFWLNHFSSLRQEENLLIRGKISGRYLPRCEYQVFFPVGLGKTLFGSHFVAAHLAPDVDTTVASFWGWLDAFSCRLSNGLHYWSLPQGLTDGHLRKFFQKNFHHSFFTALPRQNPTLSMTAMDMMTLKNYIKVPLDVHADTINHGQEGDKAIILIDDKGMYAGEWRSQDAEATRQVIDMMFSLLRWFKNTTISQLIESFAEENISKKDIEKTIKALFASKIENCDVLKDMTEQSKKQLHKYMKKLLLLPESYQHSFKELIDAINVLFDNSFDPLLKVLYQHTNEYTHTLAMKWLDTVVLHFESCLHSVRSSAKKLKHLVAIKQDILGYPTTFVTLKSNIEEMRLKIDGLDHITVVIQETNGSLFPVGIVRSHDLQKSILGSASLRDFSNLAETKAAPYIDVASIVDHHKTNITTSSASTFLVSDAQSTNTLVAEESLQLNIEFQNLPANPPENSISYWVSQEREMLEYVSQLFAILDDTDLLSKVSKRDITTVIKLLNRMKTLASVSDKSLIALPRTLDSQTGVQEAAQKLLQNQELHSIYRKVYQHRESEVEETLTLASEKKHSSFFSDTKEQNGCCRIGQTKLFASNLPTFTRCHNKLLRFWIEQSEAHFKANPAIDFYLHMLSTIQGETEVMKGGPSWSHKDELWIWIPEKDLPLQHLVTFLSSFNFSDVAQSLPLDVEVRGSRAHELTLALSNNLTKAHTVVATHEKEHYSVIIIRFPAGKINSRKTQITPFLPKQVG